MEKGIWRTVGGRRIFIKDGQDLSTAMIESGKFKNKPKPKQQYSAKEKLLFDKEFYDNFKYEDKSSIKESLNDLKKINTEKMSFDDAYDVKTKIKALEGGYTNLYDYYIEREKELTVKDYYYNPGKYERIQKEKLKQAKLKEEYKINQKNKDYLENKFKKGSGSERLNYISKKTKEDFKEMYHGGTKESVAILKKDVDIISIEKKDKLYSGESAGGNRVGLSLASDEKVAKVFSEAHRNDDIAKIYLDKSAKIYNFGESIDDLDFGEMVEIVDKGFDGIKGEPEGEYSESEIRIFNPNIIFSERELKNK